MNIIFEINHPGQVHLLRYIYFKLNEKGHQITVFAKNEKIISHLLNTYQIPYINLGNKGSGLTGKLLSQIVFDFKIWGHVKKNKTIMGLGSSITNDHVSFFTGMKSIHLSDDDEAIVPLITRFSYPFSDVILAPDCLKFPKFNKKVVSYAGTHELAYLHPNVFTPDITVLKEAGLLKNERYFILRFVALKGHHDDGHHGINYNQKLLLINLLSSFGRVIITSEKEIEPEFEKYRLPVSPEKIHSLMYYSDLFLGDSQTMTSEAAIMGVPALKCNTFAGRLSVPNELEYKYDLCYSYQPADFDKFYDHAQQLLDKVDLKDEWQKKRARFLDEKIDVTAFIVWFIENWPRSLRTMKEDADYQYKFR
jgi:hypothetical protein